MAKGKDLYNKTYQYLKRNGIAKTLRASADSVFTTIPQKYYYKPVDSEKLSQQRESCRSHFDTMKFSIVVPAYETNSLFFKEMVCSVLEQTYSNWELILVDASPKMGLWEELLHTMDHFFDVPVTVREYSTEEITSLFGEDSDFFVSYSFEEKSIVYLHLLTNGGISANSNYGISLASGDYVGLLDHDDILTPDALYSMAYALKKNNDNAYLLYSDEDKTNSDGTSFFAPHRKEDYNLDLFLSNNYFCHFTLLKSELIKKLLFRAEYDGAQDYDLFLRAILMMDSPEERILHIPKILYHWRCHEGSTAGNPKSKEYAYEAGRKAVLDFCQQSGWNVQVVSSEHLGFYRIVYQEDIFSVREHVGIVGGPIFRHQKICGGAMYSDGKVKYKGLIKGLGGYLHRGTLVQEAEAVDIRNMRVNPKLLQLYQDTVLPKISKESVDFTEVSLSFCKLVKDMGYKILYDPDLKTEQRGSNEGKRSYPEF